MTNSSTYSVFISQIPLILSINVTNSPAYSVQKWKEVSKIQRSDSCAYSVWIWRIPPHTQYKYDEFPPMLSILWSIPPHTQYEKYLNHSNPEFQSILSMRGNVSYSYWICGGIHHNHTEEAEEIILKLFFFCDIKPPLTHLRRPMRETSFLCSF